MWSNMLYDYNETLEEKPEEKVVAWTMMFEGDKLLFETDKFDMSRDSCRYYKGMLQATTPNGNRVVIFCEVK